MQASKTVSQWCATCGRWREISWSVERIPNVFRDLSITICDLKRPAYQLHVGKTDLQKKKIVKREIRKTWQKSRYERSSPPFRLNTINSHCLETLLCVKTEFCCELLNL